MGKIVKELIRISDVYKKEVDRQIEEILCLGNIEHSESKYTHPVVWWLRKIYPSVRFCVDSDT